jgi:hypothetical protein
MQTKSLLRKYSAIGIILLFVGTCIIPATAQNAKKLSQPMSRGSWLYVGGSGPGNYSSITAALHNASDDDTIYVYSGIYTEGVLSINVSVSLIGQSNISTIINHSTFIFNTTNIFLTEFSFQNFSQIYIFSQYGNDVSHNTVTNTIFTNLSSGIMIANSSYNSIINNHFDQCGIFLFPSLDPFIIFTETDDFTNTILNNTVNGKPLVYLEDVNDRYISDAGEIVLLRCMNITISQISFGIGTTLLEFIKTTNSKIILNDFKNTILYLINSSENTIADNRFYTPSGESQANGLLLFAQCSNNDILNNVFSNQSLIAISTSSNNAFKHNDFYGFRLSRPIIIFMNADNTWQRNYWMRPRILPKLIFGYKYTPPYSNLTHRSLDIDWRPTLKPNNPIPNWIHTEMYVQQKMQDPWIQFDWVLHENPMIFEENQ